MNIVSKKIVLIGDFGVGKTSLIRRFVENAFSDEYLTTIGVKISRKSVALTEASTTVQLMIWDIEGRTDIKAIAASYLLGAAGGIVVADLTRRETVEMLEQHIAQFASLNPGSPLIIALNKSDLAAEEDDDVARLSALPTVSAVYVTSAKSDENVEALFFELAARMVGHA